MIPRIGFGYDVHRLELGRPLWLACIEIPHPSGLLGHSDGDAAAHAIADACLGAAGLGDIGENFSDHDPQWKGISGARLLDETVRRLRGRGFALRQVDLSILAEAPRIGPHRGAMIEALAGALGLPLPEVSVKARSNEGIDAVGRGEAIAAYAVVLLERHG